jgi:hypothetical protein
MISTTATVKSHKQIISSFEIVREAGEEFSASLVKIGSIS